MKAQAEYYAAYINKHPDWVFVKVFEDRGASATNTKRSGFCEMMTAARNHEIDLILVKSVSRFARNTLDLLETTRELRRLGVEVYFEEQQISTLDPKCEMILTVMASLAQEESHNLSDNIKWGIRRKMEHGEFALPYRRFLGYKKGENGRPEIVKKEAKIVRRIYYLFLNGVPINRIATILTKKKIPAPGGGEKWHPKTIKSILTNEKYKGEALLQKTYVKDYLTHKSIPNKRNIRQYKVENSHPAIIDRKTFDAVQQRMASMKMK